MNDTLIGAPSTDSPSASGQFSLPRGSWEGYSLPPVYQSIGEVLTSQYSQLNPGKVVLTDGPPKDAVLVQGAKLDEGKVGVHLLPPDPLIQIARVLDFGAKKYAPYNWTKGIKYSRVYGALMRHMWAWWKGQDTDSETSISHLAHAGCCLLFLLQYEITRREYDDRPKEEYRGTS